MHSLKVCLQLLLSSLVGFAGSLQAAPPARS